MIMNDLETSRHKLKSLGFYGISKAYMSKNDFVVFYGISKAYMFKNDFVVFCFSHFGLFVIFYTKDGFELAIY